MAFDQSHMAWVPGEYLTWWELWSTSKQMLWLWAGHEEALLGSLEKGISNLPSVFDLVLFNISQIAGEKQYEGQY